MTLENSWVNVGGGYKAVCVVPTDIGTGKIFGDMGSGLANQAAFHLPANMIPAETQRVHIGSLGYVDIFAITGAVVPNFTASHVGLSGIEFLIQ